MRCLTRPHFRKTSRYRAFAYKSPSTQVRATSPSALTSPDHSLRRTFLHSLRPPPVVPTLHPHHHQHRFDRCALLPRLDFRPPPPPPPPPSAPLFRPIFFSSAGCCCQHQPATIRRTSNNTSRTSVSISHTTSATFVAMR